MSKREKRFAVKVAVAGTAAVLLVACSSEAPDCSPPPEGCPRATVTTQLLSSSITYQIGRSAPVTMALAQGSDTAADLGCNAVGWAGEGMRDSSVSLRPPHADCNDGSGLSVWMNIPDPRRISAGESIRRASDLELEITYTKCPQQGQGCTLCRVSLEDVEVDVKVDGAAGMEAPYPQMVTSDFSRQFHIEIDTGSRTARGAAFASAPLPCENLALKISLNMAQTAANYVFDPHGPCEPCE